jgi:hypothetical protein
MSRRTGGGSVTAVVAVTVGLFTGGCGVPGSGPVRTVPREEVPYGLLSPRADPFPEDRADAVGVSPGAYFLRRGCLLAVGVSRQYTGVRTQVSEALRDLSAGPTSAEQDRGLGTAIPPGLRLSVLRVSGGQVDIELSGESAHPDVAQNALAAGQIVLTVTSVPGIDSARLVHSGQPVGPVLPDGSLATGPVTAADYAYLANCASASPSPSPSSSPQR